MKNEEIRKYFRRLPDNTYFIPSLGFVVDEREYDRFLRTHSFPITTVFNNKCWLNKRFQLHRKNGPALIKKDYNFYFINGKEYTEEEFKEYPNIITGKITFNHLRVKLLKKLLEIPEQFEKVYYDNKKIFISILDKI